MRYLVLFIFVGSVLFLLVRKDANTIGLEQDDMARLIYSLALLALVGGGFLVQYKGKFSQALRDISIWLMIFLLISVGYSYRFEIELIYNKVVGNLLTSSPIVYGGKQNQFSIQRSQDGHFNVDIKTNDLSVRYLVDTGASLVVLTEKTAVSLGFQPEKLSYSRVISTANGLSRAAPVTLSSMQLGRIEINNVSALIALPESLDNNLLGMTFLNELASFRVENDQMIFLGYE